MQITLGQQYNVGEKPTVILYNRRYFQHAHFIPIVGVGKGGEY